MARPLRIEYPDAVYHVSNYSLDNKRVFPSDRYYDQFLSGVAEACARLNVEVHAYCLLRNQYHLIVKNSGRQLVQVYTASRRTLHSKLSANEEVLKGHYSEAGTKQFWWAESYLLPLSRYIHSKVKASDLTSYPFSSYKYFTRKANPPTWFNRLETQKQLRVQASKRAIAYRKYVAEGVDDRVS